MQSMEYIGTVTNGRISCRDQIARAMLRLEGKRVSFKLSEAKKQRTTPQNAFWHLVVDDVLTPALEDAYGLKFNHDEASDAVKLLVGHSKKVGMVFVPLATKDLSTEDFNLFMEKVRCFFAQYGICVPMPGEENLARPD